MATDRTDLHPSETIPRTVAWQTRPCPSWCSLVHHIVDAPSSRVCASAWRRITLTLQPALLVKKGPEPEYVSSILEVTLEQGYREAQPRILIFGEEQGYELTLDEAEDLVAALTGHLKTVYDDGMTCSANGCTPPRTTLPSTSSSSSTRTTGPAGSCACPPTSLSTTPSTWARVRRTLLGRRP